MAGSEAILVIPSGSFTESYNIVSPESKAINLCVSVSTPRPLGVSINLDPSGNGASSPTFSILNSTGDPSGAVMKQKNSSRAEEVGEADESGPEPAGTGAPPGGEACVGAAGTGAPPGGEAGAGAAGTGTPPGAGAGIGAGGAPGAGAPTASGGEVGAAGIGEPPGGTGTAGCVGGGSSLMLNFY